MKKTHLLFALFLSLFTISMTSCSINEEDDLLMETKATGNEADDPALPDDD